MVVVVVVVAAVGGGGEQEEEEEEAQEGPSVRRGAPDTTQSDECNNDILLV